MAKSTTPERRAGLAEARERLLPQRGGFERVVCAECLAKYRDDRIGWVAIGPHHLTFLANVRTKRRLESRHSIGIPSVGTMSFWGRERPVPRELPTDVRCSWGHVRTVTLEVLRDRRGEPGSGPLAI
jgi:hypothetical protein